LKLTCEALEARRGIEAIRARAFTIRGDEPAGIRREPGDRDPG
jgi:hypothetical protein